MPSEGGTLGGGIDVGGSAGLFGWTSHVGILIYAMGFIRAKTSQLAITRAYVLALVVIAGLASAGMGTTLLLLHVEEQSSVEINVAGRQRMLSQRIGMFAAEMASMRQPEAESALRAINTCSMANTSG